MLEIGARHGFVTSRLVDYFEEVTALDLQTPSFRLDRVNPIAGDVQKLALPDNSFDCVVCTEVLEHVPDVARAAQEIRRVCRHEVLIGVPYRQDTRVGRTTCSHCGRINPPFGHVNTFDEKALLRLFAGMTLVSRQTVGSNRERTNALAAWLTDLAGNPYGYYTQEEPCIHCGAKLVRTTIHVSGASPVRRGRRQDVRAARQVQPTATDLDPPLIPQRLTPGDPIAPSRLPRGRQSTARGEGSA